MPITKQTNAYTVHRVVISSPKPINAVLRDLNFELNEEKAGIHLMMKLASAASREDLETAINGMTEGKRDFLLFASGSHSRWMEAYSNHQLKFRQTVVYTIGNPLLAAPVLKNDMTAGLDIPPKLLVQETDNGGTRIIYDLPSSIMAAGAPRNAEMEAALDKLDKKFELLVNKVLTVANKL
ncbi:hypothetical protein BDY19DRAFT_935805 [Irpex rosettiformis]|uniref:Uncharacterized protein n=1 Tax=Irpex rosettiformis TaxID=378272 RepID=A0ACB8U8Q1_9APHY|nr:hypothetical protein BDY19DRAFT_935805 [Irpex rosettiformis]